MNADRRQTGQVIIALLVECSQSGLISDESHLAATGALHSMQTAEYWQLRNQEKHEGKNASTDQQLRVCRVALPALEAAVKAWDSDDFEEVITQLTLAITTDGSELEKTRKKGLRKRRG
ncbi:hypothetical protein IXEL_55 [Microbacterium phage Ixel]|nr:hypothetical protein IXEL_55 [Microbacterium phage Ixel]